MPFLEASFIKGSVATMTAVHAVAGNSSRLENGRVPLRLDDEWIAELTPTDRRLVNALTHPLRYRYGYGGVPPSLGEPNS